MKKEENPLEAKLALIDQEGVVLVNEGDVLAIREYIKYIEDSNLVWKIICLGSLITNGLFLVKIFFLS